MRLRSHQQMRIKWECSAFIALFIISDLCVVSSCSIFLFAILYAMCLSVCVWLCDYYSGRWCLFLQTAQQTKKHTFLRSHFHSCCWCSRCCFDAMRSAKKQIRRCSCRLSFSIFNSNKASERHCFQNQCLYAFIDFTPCISFMRRCFTFATYHLSLFASCSLVGMVFSCCCCFAIWWLCVASLLSFCSDSLASLSYG